MSNPLESALDVFAERTAAVGRRTGISDVAVLQVASPQREVLAVERSSSFVWLAAALERYFWDFSGALLTELNTRCLLRSTLRPSLLSLLHAPEFSRLQDVRGQKMWNERASLLQELESTSVAVFALDHVPLDGGTIEARHFDSFWHVFGFSGTPYPTPRHKFAIVDLSVARNKLAHGEVDPLVFGRTRTSGDMFRLIETVEDVGLHLHAAGFRYLSAGEYQR